jgi:hypothetical protein
MPSLPPPIEKPDISSSNMEFLKLELERLATEKVSGCAPGGRGMSSMCWLGPLQKLRDLAQPHETTPTGNKYGEGCGGADCVGVRAAAGRRGSRRGGGGRGHVTGEHTTLSTHTGAVPK